jgi:hypothetical protein
VASRIDVRQGSTIISLSLVFERLVKKPGVIIFFVFVFHGVSAQYCVPRDSFICVAAAVPDSAGLYPPVDSFPSFYNNFLTSATLQFRNFDTILFGTEVLPVYSLTWDTIENLPPGLCWTTSEANNTFAQGAAGCIHFSGLACGPTGQYKLSTLVTLDIGVLVETDGDPGGLGYMVRLQNYDSTNIPVDTTQTDSMPFIPYGGICQTLTPPVVSLGGDQTVCAGSIVTFNPVVTGGQPPYSYLWQSAGSIIICSTCANPSVAMDLDSKYLLKVTDASGGFAYDSVLYTIAGTAYNFQVTATEPDIFCGGGTAAISANPNDSVSFQWFGNGNSLAGETNRMLTVTDSSGAYYLVYTEAGICQATSNIINLLFYDTTAVSILSGASDTICIGAAVTLSANAVGNGLSYGWLVNGSNLNYPAISLSANSGGSYQVMVTNAVGCTDTSVAVLVVASPNLPPALTYDQFIDDTLCNNAVAITLSGAQPAGGYYSGTGVSNGIFNPFAANAGPNFVYYNYTDSTGCGNSVFDTIVVLLCTGIQEVDVQDDITLYPNPGVEQLTVESDILKRADARFFVFDITGKRLAVSYKRIGNNKITLDISTLSPGCYLVQLSVDGEELSRRFVKME